MRIGLLALVLASLAGARLAGAAERVLSVEAEVQGPNEKSVGKATVLVAARGTERLKGSAGSVTMTLDVEVGPTHDKDCNLVTISGRIEDSAGVGADKAKEIKPTTIHACGKATGPSPLASLGDKRLLATVRPAPAP